MAQLSGSWLAGDLSILGVGAASIRISLRTYTTQFGADDEGSAYDETVFVEQRASGDVESGTFDRATAAFPNWLSRSGRVH